MCKLAKSIKSSTCHGAGVEQVNLSMFNTCCTIGTVQATRLSAVTKCYLRKFTVYQNSHVEDWDHDPIRDILYGSVFCHSDKIHKKVNLEERFIWVHVFIPLLSVESGPMVWQGITVWCMQ